MPGIAGMEIIRDASIYELLALCGGCCSCATCHVVIDDAVADRVAPLTWDEDELLDSSDHREINSSLSRQLIFTESLNGLKITIATED
ncbi:2Fe-2S iron-sulfur cluster-binding protein [Sphingobium xenophagum]|uniref:2Fe-2S iron-sulfur cluster-binding protein n=1 Tax=Sphingobium xenophagum TaxID=121428 RepID=UPI00241F7F5F|nr:2Fe-2S iron-sulfur cluster-binding protein [Sphingobium xenophagum]